MDGKEWKKGLKTKRFWFDLLLMYLRAETEILLNQIGFKWFQCTFSPKIPKGTHKEHHQRPLQTYLASSHRRTDSHSMYIYKRSTIFIQIQDLNVFTNSTSPSLNPRYQHNDDHTGEQWSVLLRTSPHSASLLHQRQDSG